MIFAGNFAPRGWAFCDGTLLPISQNTALFSIIGITYGGNGQTTTGLPNLRDRLPMHSGTGPGLTPRRQGQRIGSDTVTLASSQIPEHSHTVTALDNPPNVSSPSAARSAIAPMYKSSASTAELTELASPAMSNTGNRQSHNNRQPYLAMYFIIALVGIYPSGS